MEITLYSAPRSSSGPVVAALAELDIPYRRVDLDLKAGEQRSAAHLARNPNGKVPALVVDGTPMFEALAIMHWLGDRFGVERGLWPAPDSPDRMTALAWSTWSYVTLGATLYRIVLCSSGRIPELQDETQTAYAKKDFDYLMGVLDVALEGRPFLLGERYSLADLIVACCVMFGASQGGPVETHANVTGWLDRVRARPAIHAMWS